MLAPIDHIAGYTLNISDGPSGMANKPSKSNFTETQFVGILTPQEIQGTLSKTVNQRNHDTSQRNHVYRLRQFSELLLKMDIEKFLGFTNITHLIWMCGQRVLFLHVIWSEGSNVVHRIQASSFYKMHSTVIKTLSHQPFYSFRSPKY